MRTRTISVLVTCGIAAGCVARTGKRATAGAVEELQQARESLDPTLAGPFAQQVARGAVEGGLEQLSRPENLALLGEILGDATGRAMLGASRAPQSLALGGTGGAGVIRTAGSPTALLAQEAGRGFSIAAAAEIHRQLGPRGDGPLSQAIASTGSEISAAVLQAAGRELALLLPECGEDRAACAERRLGELGRATAVGFMAGVRESLGPLPLILAFALGFFVALAILWAWSLLRSVRRLA